MSGNNTRDVSTGPEEFADTDAMTAMYGALMARQTTMTMKKQKKGPLKYSEMTPNQKKRYVSAKRLMFQSNLACKVKAIRILREIAKEMKDFNDDLYLQMTIIYDELFAFFHKKKQMGYPLVGGLWALGLGSNNSRGSGERGGGPRGRGRHPSRA